MKTTLKDVHEAVALALRHFYDEKAAGTVGGLPPLEEFRLDRALQYDLCTMFARVTRTLGECTSRDVVMFCECWLSANRTVFGFPLAIVKRSTPEETRRPADIICLQMSDETATLIVQRALQLDDGSLARKITEAVKA
jgi:hypothetical protein